MSRLGVLARRDPTDVQVVNFEDAPLARDPAADQQRRPVGLGAADLRKQVSAVER
ncbi:hypothetical protein ACWGHA_08475 [Streptomyces xanthophaeus]